MSMNVEDYLDVDATLGYEDRAIRGTVRDFTRGGYGNHGLQMNPDDGNEEVWG
jgi:hypothetical protein